jgi:hypothetical protein
MNYKGCLTLRACGKGTVMDSRLSLALFKCLCSEKFRDLNQVLDELWFGSVSSYISREKFSGSLIKTFKNK